MSEQSHLVEVKSTLAKLMATENIYVVHKNVKQPYFDIIERKLVCPIWKDMGGDLYDLLMGHEISHALFTPPEELFTAVIRPESEIKANDIISGRVSPNALTNKHIYKGLSSYINILEDARIERLIKRRFPGLKKPFFNGYKDLYNRDYFGILGLETKGLKRLSLIDRLNIHFKLGSFLDVPFSDEELVYVNRIEKAKTFKDVKDIAFELYQEDKDNNDGSSQDSLEDMVKAYVLEKENGEYEESDQSQKELSDLGTPKDSSEDEDEGKGEDEDPEGDGKSDSDDESEDDESKGDGESEESESGKDQNDQGESADLDTATETKPQDKQNVDEEPRSLTQENFDKEYQKLIDDESNTLVDINLPKVNLDRLIIPNGVMLDNFNKSLSSLQQIKDKEPVEVTTKKLRELFNKRNSGYINNLIKEFEMKKNATDYRRQLESKSGELDMQRLYRYRFNSDIFRKITTTPKGKSHGMVLFLDMSGSMERQFSDVLEQILCLISFAKKVGIPFVVYGFTDCIEQNIARSMKPNYGAVYSSYNSRKSTNNDYCIPSSNFRLKVLIDSKSTTSDFKKSFDMILYSIAIYNGYGVYKKVLYSIDSLFTVQRNHTDPNFVGMQLGQTPLLGSVLATPEVIKKFNRENKVDILNVIYLTDGGPTDRILSSNSFAGGNAVQLYVNDPQNLTIKITNPDTGDFIYSVKEDTVLQNSLIRLIKKSYGVRMLGIYVSHSNDLIRNIGVYRIDHLSSLEIENYRREIIDDNYVKVNMNGFDTYYFMKSNLNVDSDTGYDNVSTPAGIRNKFIDYNKHKVKSYVLAREFAGEIATLYKTA